MNRWRERDSYPQLTLFGWLLCFPGHCVRQSVFPAFPGALGCKASSQRASFWVLFNPSAFAFLRLSDKGVCAPHSVRASHRGWWVTAQTLLVVGKAQLPKTTMGTVLSVLLGSFYTPSALRYDGGSARGDNSTVAQQVGARIHVLLSSHILYLPHHCFIICWGTLLSKSFRECGGNSWFTDRWRDN